MPRINERFAGRLMLQFMVSLLGFVVVLRGYNNGELASESDFQGGTPPFIVDLAKLPECLCRRNAVSRRQPPIQLREQHGILLDHAETKCCE